MKKSYLVICGVFCFLIAMFFLSGSPEKVEEEIQPEVTIIRRVKKAPIKQSIKEPEKTEVVKVDKPKEAVNEQKEEILTEYSTKAESREKLKAIAKDFAERAKYPRYSQPLDETDYSLLHPNEFVSTDRKVDGSDKMTFSMKFPKRTFLHPETVAFTVTIQSGEKEFVPQTSVQIDIINGISGSTKPVDSFSLDQSIDEETKKVFIGEYSPSHEIKWEEEIVFRGSITMNGFPNQQLSELIEYRISVGEIVGMHQVEIEGPNLIMPIEVSTEKDGYYNVTGNLFSQETGKPIAHLNLTKKIDSNNHIIPLKLHIATIKKKGDFGPYTLKDLQLSRINDKSERNPSAGKADGMEFDIPGFPLSEYSDEEYVSKRMKNKVKGFDLFTLGRPATTPIPNQYSKEDLKDLQGVRQYSPDWKPGTPHPSNPMDNSNALSPN